MALIIVIFFSSLEKNTLNHKFLPCDIAEGVSNLFAAVHDLHV